MKKLRLKGNSPVRGNVCKADKRVPVSGRKGGTRSVTERSDSTP